MNNSVYVNANDQQGIDDLRQVIKSWLRDAHMMEFNFYVDLELRNFPGDIKALDICTPTDYPLVSDLIDFCEKVNNDLLCECCDSIVVSVVVDGKLLDC